VAASEGGLHGGLYNEQWLGVYAILFGQVDGEEWALGDRCVGALAKAFLRSYSASQDQGYWAV
jgi:hypothetical protein